PGEIFSRRAKVSISYRTRNAFIGNDDAFNPQQVVEQLRNLTETEQAIEKTLWHCEYSSIQFGVIDLTHSYQNRLFFQSIECGAIEFVGISRYSVEVFPKSIRRVCVDKIDTILNWRLRL